MAFSVKAEYNFAFLSLVVAVEIGFILGLLINSFIVAVNIMNWFKERPMTANDQVITSIAIARILLQSACLFHIFVTVFFNSNYLNLFLIIMMVMSNYSSIWLTNLLAIVFFLKIFNFQNVFFQKLKAVVSQKALYFIAGSILLSFFYGVLYTWLDYTTVLANTTESFTVTWTHNMQTSLKYFIYFFLGYTVPFLIYLIILSLLVFFLYFHMSKIKTSSSLLGLDNYYTALKSVACCFLCYSFNVGSNLIVMYYYDSLSIVLINVIFNIFPALHSVFIIYRTPKLKTGLLRLFKCGTSCALNRGGSGPNF
uniref:Taste receptor type 2 n=1 Tax=Pyxicephalus adspersus TaxID=30357 RepID=A0AAV3AKC4_PYXAD|nr:TPA: hypothetical protein GDO54_009870 [Pyxicephalus adspersus]